MFTQNEYYIKYQAIIESRKNNLYDGYTEKHHIIPVSLGGSDDPINLVNLTPEEHYRCHSILPYFTEGNNRYKMIYAWNAINGFTRSGKDVDGENVLGEEVYGILKRAYALILSVRFSGSNNPRFGRNKGEDNGMYGKTHSDETRKLMSDKRIGFEHSDKTKKKMSKKRQGSDNPNFKKIEIYNADGKLMFENTNNFLKLLKDNGLPAALAKSYRRGGTPIYKNGCVPTKYKSYTGWYAIQINKEQK